MEVNRLVEGIKESLSVDRVFGQPVERDGVTVIPVARISAGVGGGGGGEGPTEGSGGGFGLRARPAGVYVLRDGRVDLQPALDLNRVIAGGQAIGLVALLMLRGWLRRRRKRR